MASASGYSGTPLFKKLGYRAGMSVVAIGMPPEVRALIESGVEGIRWSARGSDIEAAHLFTTRLTELSKQLKSLKKALQPTGFVWVSWPKKTSGVPTEVGEHQIREIALPLGLVDIKVCAVSEVWSGLKLVIPVKDRQ